MRKLKAGIIGTGMALERLHYPAYQKLADRYERDLWAGHRLLPVRIHQGAWIKKLTKCQLQCYLATP